MRHAVIDRRNLEVINVIMWEGYSMNWPEHWLVTPSDVAEIGDVYNPQDKTFHHIVTISAN